jgi:hypothetical protein
MNRLFLGFGLVLGLCPISGCSIFVRDTSYTPVIDPGLFVEVFDNPFFPLRPETTYRYKNMGDEGVQDIVVTVMPTTKDIVGVTTAMVHDVLSQDGEVREDTWDWFAQDRDGNVWYFGEDTKAYERGKVRTDGFWETGVKGPLPGIVMPAHPSVGQSHRQEYLIGEAKDEGQIIALDQTVTVAAGIFSGCVKSKEWSRLEPGVIEHKY